jgi:hypothetical protein
MPDRINDIIRHAHKNSDFTGMEIKAITEFQLTTQQLKLGVKIDTMKHTKIFKISNHSQSLGTTSSTLIHKT